ncbi:hypothetical protein ANN_11552, partial [Periplaneta americana]
INLVLKMKTEQSTEMKAPKPMQLVILAIKDLREPSGPTPKKIANYIMSRYPTDGSKLKRQVDTALKRGVTYGILRTDKGRYQLEDLENGSKHMRSHRCRRSRSGRRHSRGRRRRSSGRRRRRRSRSGRRHSRGGRRRSSSLLWANEDFILLNSTTSLSILEIHLPIWPPIYSTGPTQGNTRPDSSRHEKTSSWLGSQLSFQPKQKLEPSRAEPSRAEPSRALFSDQALLELYV